MIAEPMDAAPPGRRRGVCRVFPPLLLLFLAACSQVATPPAAKPTDRQTPPSSAQTPEQQAAESAAREKWAADKRAAEERAAALWEADKRRLEKRAAEKRAAEKRAAQKRAAEKRAEETQAAERLEAELAEARRVEAELAAAERLEAERAEAARAEAEREEAARAEAEREEAARAEAERAEAEREEAARAEAARAEAEREEAARAEAERAEAERAEAERAEAERAEAEREEAAKIEESKESTAETVRPTVKRDWSEVTYPWEQPASTPLAAETAAAQADIPSEAAADGEQKSPVVASETSQATAQRDWSKVKYPWEEEGGSTQTAEGPETSAGSVADTDAARGGEGPTPGPSGKPAQRDWSQLKYPWEEPGGTPATPSPPDTGSEEKKALSIELRTQHKARRRPVSLKEQRIAIGSIQLEMVKLPGGRFLMGSSDGDDDERPQHEVQVRPFQIGRYEVTQRQWVAVMGENPSYFHECADCPVDSVSWDDIQRFIDKLNQKTGKRFRLPSEAEWEYACRAGGDERYCGGSDETQVAWYAQNSEGRSRSVGRLEANAFGLHDMSGNVYEWVADCWHESYRESPADGRVWGSGDCQRRVLRGGAWYYAPGYALATYRNANTPGSRFIIYGFRLAHGD